MDKSKKLEGLELKPKGDDDAIRRKHRQLEHGTVDSWRRLKSGMQGEGSRCSGNPRCIGRSTIKPIAICRACIAKDKQKGSREHWLFGQSDWLLVSCSQLTHSKSILTVAIPYLYLDALHSGTHRNSVWTQDIFVELNRVSWISYLLHFLEWNQLSAWLFPPNIYF